MFKQTSKSRACSGHQESLKLRTHPSGLKQASCLLPSASWIVNLSQLCSQFPICGMIRQTGYGLIPLGSTTAFMFSVYFYISKYSLLKIITILCSNFTSLMHFDIFNCIKFDIAIKEVKMQCQIWYLIVFASLMHFGIFNVFDYFLLFYFV